MLYFFTSNGGFESPRQHAQEFHPVFSKVKRNP